MSFIKEGLRGTSWELRQLLSRDEHRGLGIPSGERWRRLRRQKGAWRPAGCREASVAETPQAWPSARERKTRGKLLFRGGPREVQSTWGCTGQRKKQDLEAGTWSWKLNKWHVLRPHEQDCRANTLSAQAHNYRWSKHRCREMWWVSLRW